jgi:hypothetical protein
MSATPAECSGLSKQQCDIDGTIDKRKQQIVQALSKHGKPMTQNEVFEYVRDNIDHGLEQVNHLSPSFAKLRKDGRVRALEGENSTKINPKSRRKNSLWTLVPAGEVELAQPKVKKEYYLLWPSTKLLDGPYTKEERGELVGPPATEVPIKLKGRGIVVG